MLSGVSLQVGIKKLGSVRLKGYMESKHYIIDKAKLLVTNSSGRFRKQNVRLPNAELFEPFRKKKFRVRTVEAHDTHETS